MLSICKAARAQQPNTAVPPELDPGVRPGGRPSTTSRGVADIRDVTQPRPAGPSLRPMDPPT